MNKVILNIGGMSCAACAGTIEKYLNKQKGIINASVNLVLGQAMITYDNTLTIKDLERFIKESGYISLGVYNAKKESKKDHSFIFLIIYSILAIILLYITMRSMFGVPIPKFITKYNLIIIFSLTIIFLIYGHDILSKGIKNLFHLSPNMDSLVTLGVIASFTYSLINMIEVFKGNMNAMHNIYFESCAIIIYFIKLGRFIDKKAKDKTKESLKELVTITPSKALLKKDSEEIEIAIDEVRKKDILICKRGMKIAVDGVITEGKAYFDEAFITGESNPSKKKKGDKVLAGSINLDGYVLYEAKNIGKDSMISQIVRLVIEATNSKTKLERIADKISYYFVPSIIIIALVTLISYLILGFNINESLTSFVSVLVVACPCALGLATPLANVISIGLCAKKGILIKSSEVLESARTIDTVVFDKTGTLTYGTLKVAKIINNSKLNNKELMTLVCSLERLSTHPIAASLINYAKEKKLELQLVEDYQELSGMGLKGIINNQSILVGNKKLLEEEHITNSFKDIKEDTTIIYVVIDKELVAYITIEDIIRDSSKKAIKELKNLGIEVIMLTGDNEVTAKHIADNLSITNVIAEVLPEDKAKVIAKLNKEDKHVMMVGDGINDAISLSKSLIGVSLNSGTDIAFNSSNVILIHDDLTSIVTLINISKKTTKIIKQNLFWAFIYNILMIPLAIGLFKGFNLSLNPMIASIAMMISSLSVVFNSLRLKKG